MNKEISQSRFLLSYCQLCGERYEKTSIEDSGAHVCAPESQWGLDLDSETS